MQLTIVTPTKKEQFDISWIELNTDQGNYVIQAGHAATFFTLKAHAPFTYCLKNGEQVAVMVKRAMVEVTRTYITVLLADFE